MSSRNFVLKSSSLNIKGKRCKADVPKGAAVILADKLFKNAKSNKISICVKETTKGSSKKSHDYVAERVKSKEGYKVKIRSDRNVQKMKNIKKRIKGGSRKGDPRELEQYIIIDSIDILAEIIGFNISRIIYIKITKDLLEYSLDQGLFSTNYNRLINDIREKIKFNNIDRITYIKKEDIFPQNRWYKYSWLLDHTDKDAVSNIGFKAKQYRNFFRNDDYHHYNVEFEDDFKGEEDRDKLIEIVKNNADNPSRLLNNDNNILVLQLLTNDIQVILTYLQTIFEKDKGGLIKLYSKDSKKIQAEIVDNAIKVNCDQNYIFSVEFVKYKNYDDFYYIRCEFHSSRHTNLDYDSILDKKRESYHYQWIPTKPDSNKPSTMKKLKNKTLNFFRRRDNRQLQPENTQLEGIQQENTQQEGIQQEDIHQEGIQQEDIQQEDTQPQAESDVFEIPDQDEYHEQGEDKQDEETGGGKRSKKTKPKSSKKTQKAKQSPIKSKRQTKK
jgi:hypothetical protein